MNLSVLLLFTEHVQNVCYEDSQEESKTPQIRIHWKGYPGENQTCELPNFGRMRKTGELTKSFLQSQSSRTPPPPPNIIWHFAPKMWPINLLKLVMTCILLLKTSGCWHTNWTELSKGKVNQDWSWASLVHTVMILSFTCPHCNDTELHLLVFTNVCSYMWVKYYTNSHLCNIVRSYMFQSQRIIIREPNFPC